MKFSYFKNFLLEENIPEASSVFKNQIELVGLLPTLQCVFLPFHEFNGQ